MAAVGSLSAGMSGLEINHKMDELFELRELKQERERVFEREDLDLHSVEILAGLDELNGDESHLLEDQREVRAQARVAREEASQVFGRIQNLEASVLKMDGKLLIKRASVEAEYQKLLGKVYKRPSGAEAGVVEADFAKLERLREEKTSINEALGKVRNYQGRYKVRSELKRELKSLTKQIDLATEDFARGSSRGIEYDPHTDEVSSPMLEELKAQREKVFRELLR